MTLDEVKALLERAVAERPDDAPVRTLADAWSDLIGGIEALAVRLAETGEAEAPAPSLPVFAREKFADEVRFPGRLAFGARQRAVVRLQEWLTLRGHATAIDGIFGPDTSAALRAFAGTDELGVEAWERLTGPMQEAHAPLSGTASDIHALTLEAAERHLAAAARELSHGGQGNRGPWVRLYMLGNEGDAWPWCAGFVSHVVGQAAAALGQAMPMRREVSVDRLVADARADRRFLAEARLATPAARRTLIRPGTVFCIRRTATDWTHTGIVRSVTEDFFTTVEGNSNPRGGREGIAVVSNRRGWQGVDFIALS